VGGGNSVAQASLQFANVAGRVTLVVRDASLKSSVSTYLIDRIYSHPRIEVLSNTIVTALDGDTSLQSITVKNLLTSKLQTFPARRLFVCIGGVPRTDWAHWARIQRDEAGYLLTAVDLRRKRKSHRKLAARSRTVLSRNEFARLVCRRRCASRLRKALRLRRRRRRYGRHAGPPLPRRRLTAREF
jgi:alkyl hydroperoxide reductase subunit AhpF